MIILKCVFVVTGLTCNVFGILGGYDVDIELAPYQVNYGDICGGVLIHMLWVLTVAHCGTEKNFIRVGSKYRLKGSPKSIKHHFVHPLYGKKHEFDYDVQLLELREALKRRNTVGTIHLSGGEYGEFVYVFGWGYAMEKGEYLNVLQQVKLRLVTTELCQDVNQPWYNHTLTSRMFCAGDRQGDACQGDSGGAAVSYNLLVGVSSFGFGCGRNVPGVYVNVSSPNIRLWIRRYTGIN